MEIESEETDCRYKRMYDACIWGEPDWNETNDGEITIKWGSVKFEKTRFQKYNSGYEKEEVSSGNKALS